MLLAGLGGLAGASLRFLVGGWVQRLLPASTRRRCCGCPPDLPLVVEIVDSREAIEAFMPVIDGVIEAGLATLEHLEIRLYGSGGGEASPHLAAGTGA